jgi:hypothetical protein
VLDFERNEQPTTEQSESVGRLEAASTEDSGSVGVIQTPGRAGVETQYSKAPKDTHAGFERVFGKASTFVRSRTDRVLPLDGVVLPSRPNAIFLDADDNAKVTGLPGRELAQTLQIAPVTIEHLLRAQLSALPWTTFVECYRRIMPEIEAMSARTFMAEGIPILAQRVRRGHRVEPELPRDRQEVSENP